MGQQQSISQPPSARNYKFETHYKKAWLQHEGILKLRPTPFPNCLQIETGTQTLFLQDAQMSLADLLKNRLFTNRLFPFEDIEKLIEGVIYTLAYLEENKVVYQDMTADNIYYTNGVFKLLPNELIEMSTYQRALKYVETLKMSRNIEFDPNDNPDLPYLSPQLIIALRYKEKQIHDFDLLQKSNVFIFGLILLEVTTLMPSSECYDQLSYDIFNSVISERLELIEEHYDKKIARIIGNMLDYDYTERMGLKSLAIWINRDFRDELKNSAFSQQDRQKMKATLSKSKLQKVAFVEKQSDVHEQLKHEPRQFSRSNLVYMNNGNNYEYQKQEENQLVGCRGNRNQIYLDQKGFQNTMAPMVGKASDQRQGTQNRIYRGTEINHEQDIYHGRHYQKQDLDHEYENYEQFKHARNERKNYSPYMEDKQAHFDRNITEQMNQLEMDMLRNRGSERDYGQRKALNEDYQRKSRPHESIWEKPDELPTTNYRPERQQPKKSKITHQNNPYYNPKQTTQQNEQLQPLKIKNLNKYFPNLDDVTKPKPTETTKRVAKHMQVGKTIKGDLYDSKESDSKQSANDSSIQRIKMQIEKSRKLIQQFRRSEGLSEN